MIKKLKSKHDYVLAVEIIDYYKKEDLQQFENWFEEMVKNGQDQLNLLFKIDKLPISHISFKTFLDDAIFSVKHLENCGHLAMVGHSKVEKIMIAMESLSYNRPKKGMLEKYFDVKDIDEAWSFVNAR